MSNSPVDATEEEDLREASHIGFGIKTDQVRFYKRMAFWFYQNNLINEPKLSSLTKAALNIAGHRFAKFEEVAFANYVQKELAKARGPSAPYMRLGQYQAEQAARQGQTLKQEASVVIPPELRKAPPVDKIKEPEWYGVYDQQ